MSNRVGNVVVITPEPDGVCNYCGAVEETRPYGINGARVCYECGMKPENIEETRRRMNAFLNGAKTEEAR